ncbi:MAG: altronate dehydratase family protein [Pseudomonadota bacterium]
MHTFVRLNEDDDVVTATRPLEAGAAVEDCTTNALIPRGHKIATRALKAGDPVRKYAQIIGYAASDIAAGDHVHDHNLAFRATDFEYSFCNNLRPPPAPTAEDTFLGFHRENGKVGTRNYIAVLTSVNCSATAAHKIAAHFTPERLAPYPNVDGVVAFAHGTGCGMAGSGDGFAALQRTMWGYARHPNHAGVLMVGLGCEINQIDWLLEAYGLKQGPLFNTMNIQDVAGLRRTVEAGIAKIEAMLPRANEIKRAPAPVSKLTVALQCGGSDAWSGITANPALGYACDLLAAQGGTGLLAETPEIYGAEHLLAERAATPKIGEKLIARIKWWEDYVARNQGSMDNNPSPGNKRGGLSTILEKSLGAAAKGGTTPLTGVYAYAEEATEPGFGFMDSPGYDPASVTGQIASGSNVVVFTTGRGSAFGSKPAPTIKIATNSELYTKMNEDMDVDAGPILTGEETVESVGRAIYERIIKVASGEKSKSEAQGLGDYEFVPWQIGAVM